MPDDNRVVFKVDGEEYELPAIQELGLGEMCDAEEFFHVELGGDAKPGMRMTAALLWVAMRRKDSTVTVEQVRNLPMSVFEDAAGDASPPDHPPEDSTPPQPSGDSSGDALRANGDVPAETPQPTGVPG